MDMICSFTLSCIFIRNQLLHIMQSAGSTRSSDNESLSADAVTDTPPVMKLLFSSSWYLYLLSLQEILFMLRPSPSLSLSQMSWRRYRRRAATGPQSQGLTGVRLHSLYAFLLTWLLFTDNLLNPNNIMFPVSALSLICL